MQAGQLVGAVAHRGGNARYRLAAPSHGDRAVVRQHFGLENWCWCRGFPGAERIHPKHLLVLVVNGQALVGEIDHQAGNEIDHQEGFTSPDFPASFVSHVESLWFLGSVGSKIEQSFALWRVPSLRSSDAPTLASPPW